MGQNYSCNQIGLAEVNMMMYSLPFLSSSSYPPSTSLPTLKPSNSFPPPALPPSFLPFSLFPSFLPPSFLPFSLSLPGGRREWG